VTGDDTHGHVDDICRFVNRKTMVLIREDNPARTSTTGRWRKIGSASRTCGSKTAPSPEVVALPMPAPLVFRRVDRLPASYANFLHIANAAVDRPHLQRPQRPRGAGHPWVNFSRTGKVVGIHSPSTYDGLASDRCTV
jgi:agmatine deiminase